MSDSLDGLVGAYRADADRGRAASAETRIRLLRSVHRRHARRRLAAALSIVGAIVLSNATTWAWSTGRVDAWLEGSFGTNDDTEAPSERRPEAPDDATPDLVASGASSGGIETDVEPSLSEPAAPSPVEESGSTPSDGNRAAPRENGHRARRVVRAPSATQGGQVAPVPDDALDDALAELDSDADVRERRAFQDAHDVHFRRDYGEALRRWDRYLTSYPRGRFLPEARYNRAIALLRLSRFAEARTALSALASSSAGGGRRDDARRLLEAMDEGRLTVPGEPSAR